jgi:phage gpG-like protein
MPGVTITTPVDEVEKRLKAVRELLKMQVLVGVPDANANRQREPGDDSDINNAALAYIHNYGSPANNIPARPFMEPGIKAARAQIVRFMGAAGRAAIDGKPDEIRRNFEKVGLVTQAAIQKKITDGPFTPLAPATLAARRARGRTGTGPLIDTGQLRRSITFVIRRKKK